MIYFLNLVAYEVVKSLDLRKISLKANTKQHSFLHNAGGNLPVHNGRIISCKFCCYTQCAENDFNLPNVREILSKNGLME